MSRSSDREGANPTPDSDKCDANDGTTVGSLGANQGNGIHGYQSELQYGKILQLDTLLNCQTSLSQQMGKPAHDEHLFIIIHQIFELWFKQLLFELDSVRELFRASTVNESGTFLIINRLQRMGLIIKQLTDHFQILETMTPLDFMDFRGFFFSASGFQSVQFRLLENKLGVKEEHRVKYSQQLYKDVFRDKTSEMLIADSINDPSLLELVEKWLERTPGLEEEGFHFWSKFQRAAEAWIEDEFLKPGRNETDASMKDRHMTEYVRQKKKFEAIFDTEQYNASVANGERRLSHKALEGALMITLYRDEARFYQPFTILTLLVEVDSLLSKWRYSHVTMVQKMLGGKAGTGGSSGYMYLRSTVSDRYKVFIDLFNLSTYLIPRDRIPVLSPAIKTRLAFQDLVKTPPHPDMVKEHSVLETTPTNIVHGSSLPSQEN